MLAKHLTGAGEMWTHYLQACAYSYKSFANPALDGLGPFQLPH